MHHKQQTTFNKKSKRINQLKLLIILAITVLLLFNSHYLLSIVFIVLFYIMHEVLWSDHIFYNVKQDYQYNFQADFTEEILLQNNEIIWKEAYKDKTIFLEVELECDLAGYLFDPSIDLQSQSQQQHQFFERGLKGRRYINLSHINDSSCAEKIQLVFKYCHLNNSRAILHGFVQPDLSDKTILVVAPHADDAEIAAFGVYSQTDSFITTITAGETEAGFYESVTASKEEASCLKGRLRAWDSISVPQWAGLKGDSVVQLGYFCLTLKKMYDQPDKKTSSLTAGIDDPAYFRVYNQFSLASDKSVNSSWNSLIKDLQEIIERVKPDVILTAHPVLDPHADHRYATIACLQACEQSNIFADFLLYANHYNHTEMFPFGLSGSLLSLPPEFDQQPIESIPVSYQLSQQRQHNKLLALTMMHDLQTPVSLKKRVRQVLQEKLIGREKFLIGHDDFLRKAVRKNELFFKLTTKQLKLLIDKQVAGQ